MGASIPRILHQTFRSRDFRPEVAGNIEDMKSRNPAWEYRFYDNDGVRKYILDSYGPQFIAYFDALNPKYGAAKADLFRYLLMYKEGGVYLDLKSRASRPLDEVLQPTDRYLLSQWTTIAAHMHRDLRDIPGGEYQQWFIAAAPGHPYLKTVIEAVLRNIASYTPLRHSVGKPATLRTTGPIAYTRAIFPIRDLHPHRLVDSERDLGLDYSIYVEQEHEKVLGGHYSEVFEELVTGGVTTKAAAALRRTIKIVLRRS
jgi:mannosyltransferase OCH1-like enzyme